MERGRSGATRERGREAREEEVGRGRRVSCEARNQEPKKKKKDGGRQREPLWTPIDDGSCGILTCPPFLPPIHDGSVLPVSVVPPQSRTFPLSPSIQDLGNTNFSILLPRKLFDRSLGAEMVARAIRCGMGIQRATVNERGDVVLKAGEEGAGEGWKKVRGGHVGEDMPHVVDALGGSSVLDLTFDCSPPPPPVSLARSIAASLASSPPRSRALRTRLSRNALTITARC